jgi:drug/metabolite transporter (DMT)-like permease
MAVVLALAAALAYATASVLQHRAARQTPPENALRLRLLLDLMRRPTWLLGYAANVLAYLLEVVALGRGALVLVQPLLVTGLLFGLPLAAVFEGRRVTARELGAAAALVTGLAAFLLAASPGEGTPDVALSSWLVLGTASVAIAVVMVRTAPREAGERRSLQLAVAAAALIVVSASLTKAVANIAAHDVLAVFTTGHVYALVPFLIAGLVVMQSAFQAAPIGPSLSVLNGLPPLLGVGAGALLFHEAISVTGIAPLVEIAGAVLVAAGIAVLSRPVVLTQAPS